MNQKDYLGAGSIKYIKEILDSQNPKRIFLVTQGNVYHDSGVDKIINPLLKKYLVIRFTDFSLNPKLEDILKGLALFCKNKYDLIMAIGGGSTIDMAKSINILANQLGQPIDYIKGVKEIKRKGKCLIAIPTTAGSGSEATHFAAVYINKVKYSLAHPFILPNYTIIDPQLTLSMPKGVASVTAIDALSQAIESYWSINSTDESKSYSQKAIKIILENIRDSVNRPLLKSREAIVRAAHLAGQAINITKTTTAHALSYTLTAKFDIPHGQAVALFLGPILEYNAGITDNDCHDKRGVFYVLKIIQDLCSILGGANPQEANQIIKKLIKDIGLKATLKEIGIIDEKIKELIDEVNYQRLANNPRKLTIQNKDILINLLRC